MPVKPVLRGVRLVVFQLLTVDDYVTYGIYINWLPLSATLIAIRMREMLRNFELVSASALQGVLVTVALL